MVSKYLILLIFCCATACAQAAEMKSATMRDGRIVVTVFGEITPGDTDSFKSAVKAANDVGKLVASVRLNSIGGNLAEGVRLAEAIRFGKIATLGKMLPARQPVF